MEIVRRVDESAGAPVRIKGTVLRAFEDHSQFWITISFGRGNVLVLSTYLVQIMELTELKPLGLDVGAFDVFAIKSRVHFRRGLHDNGFAQTILLVEPAEPFFGLVEIADGASRNQQGLRRGVGRSRFQQGKACKPAAVIAGGRARKSDGGCG